MKFSKTYQPKPKWTEEKAIKLGNELIAWLKASPDNIYFEEFLFIEKDLYLDLPRYLAEKFDTFSELLEKARKIQELKLIKYSNADQLNASITKFVLINNHGYTSERTKNENINTNTNTIINLGNGINPDETTD